MPGNLSLVACWSKAGVGTSIVLECTKSKKRRRIVLDLGATPIFEECIRASCVLISHGHLDHIGAIFSHARAHAVSCGGSVPTYCVPEEIVPQLERARDAMFALDGDDRPSQIRIVGVQAGDEIELAGLGGLFVRVFSVKHTCPAVGYVIGSIQEPVLKPEYRGLDKNQIRDLILKGVAVKTEPSEVLEASYTGDTCLGGLLLAKNVSADSSDEREQKNALYLRQAFQCAMFFCEATYLDDSKKAIEGAPERGHMHVKDVVEALSQHGFERYGGTVVLLHMSARYCAKSALDHIVFSMPRNLQKRCLVAIASLLSQRYDRSDDTWRQLVSKSGSILLSDYIAAKETTQHHKKRHHHHHRR